MAMAMMEMLPQMEVEHDIFNPSFLRVAAGVVKNIPTQRAVGKMLGVSCKSTRQAWEVRVAIQNGEKVRVLSFFSTQIRALSARWLTVTCTTTPLPFLGRTAPSI